MSVTSNVQDEEQTDDWYLASLEQFEQSQPERTNGRVEQLRSESLEQFRKVGFPTSELEEWKYTSTKPIRENEFHYISDASSVDAVSSDDVDEFRIPDLDAHQMVFVNGFFSEDLSSTQDLPDAVTLTDLNEAVSEQSELVEEHLGEYVDEEEYAFAALNTAFLNHGAFLHVPDGVIVDKPIHILHLTTTEEDYGVVFPRSLFVVEENSKVSILEHFADNTDAVYFSNTVSEIYAGRNSIVDHYKLQMNNDNSFQVSTIESEQDADSTVNQTNIHFGSQLTRNDINATIEGEGAESALNGLFCTDGDQHVDNHTRLFHMQPNCDSFELYTGVLDDDSTGVFNGTIFVHKRAQGTSSNQHNNNLLLTNEAEINTKPELEIFADDVTCSHGATIGQLQERAKYYLRTRGVDKELAEQMLINAFAKELTNRIQIDPLREMVNSTFYARRDE